MPVGPPASQPEIVDPRWLLRMLGLVIAAALVCGYLTLGLLFYLGSWQLVLKPTRDAGKDLGLSTEQVRFGDGAQGKVLVSGEWFAAERVMRESFPPDHAPASWSFVDPNATRSAYTAIYLRGADGQLDAGDGTQIQTLHDHGLNVLAFDYRGFGSNPAQPHPTEERMLQDADTAWTYLVQTRKIAPDHIVVFGSGVGVSLGAQLLTQHKGAAGLIGYNADADVLARVGRDGRSKLFPLWLVFHERFSLDALKRLPTPKLLYSTGPLDTTRLEVYRTATDPKMTVEVPTHDAKQEGDALSRFLDQYLPRGLQLLPFSPSS